MVGRYVRLGGLNAVGRFSLPIGRYCWGDDFVGRYDWLADAVSRCDWTIRLADELGRLVDAFGRFDWPMVLARARLSDGFGRCATYPMKLDDTLLAGTLGLWDYPTTVVWATRGSAGALVGGTVGRYATTFEVNVP